MADLAISTKETFMFLQHHLPDPVLRNIPKASIFREYSRQARIALATSDQEQEETRACEVLRGPKEPIDASRQRMEKGLLQSPERDSMLAAVPGLRAFAISLCGSADRADDLVQETLRRAIANVSSFQAGTNMMAWLFTILRNQFLSEYRKRRREVEDADGRYADTLKSHPEQTGRVEFEEFRTALAKLPSDQREALILVGASGFSYEDAASICGCAVGTIKSRVNRARTRLADLLAIDSVDDFGPDRPTRAVLAGGGRN